MEGDPLDNEDDPFDIGGGENSQDPFSMDEEPEKWITTENNVHIPVEKGESKKEACKEFFKEKENTKNESKNIKNLLGEEIKGVKGQKAIDALLEKRSGHVKRAFTRTDTGSIDLIWGDETKGLCHIIERRKEQGINVTDFLKDLGEVIEKGQLVRTNNKGRYEIFHNGKMAIIEPELTNGQLTFLLTAFKKRKP